MKVRVQYTVDVDDDYRRAIRQYYGDKGKATRKEIVDFLYVHGQSMNDDLAYEYDDNNERTES